MQEENKNKFIIIAPLSALSKRTRLFKLAKFFNSNFDYKIEHVAWERIPNESKEDQLDFKIKKSIILSGGGYGGSKIKGMYFIWMFKSFFKCLTISKNNTVWALGFESAFPAMLASKIRGFKVVFDDADRFSMLFNFPKPISKLIQFFEKITSRAVTFHVIPGIERYNFNSSKFYVLKNMPSLTEITKAKDIYSKKEWSSGDLVININGWLGEGRGMDTILKVCKNLQDYNVKFILVGKLDCDAAIEMVKLKKVHFLGSVSNAEALSSYFASDFVFTYYDPKTKINTLAESNKWGDAIKIGIGIIVNKEVITANYLHEANVTISYNYNDDLSLTNELIKLLNNKKALNQIKENTVSISNKFGYYEEQLESLFNKLKL